MLYTSLFINDGNVHQAINLFTTKRHNLTTQWVHSPVISQTNQCFNYIILITCSSSINGLLHCLNILSINFLAWSTVPDDTCTQVCNILNAGIHVCITLYPFFYSWYKIFTNFGDFIKIKF